MHHSTFIGYLASIYKPKVYVELGLYHGETISKVRPHAQTLFGVDMTPNNHLDALKKFDNLNILYTTTDEFFETFDQKIDMAFIDADHCISSCLKDFDNILSRLNPGGVILLHDTDPESDRLIDPCYCGDSHKIVDILEKRSDLNIITFPILEAGLSVVTRVSSTRKHRRDLVSNNNNE